MLLRVKKSNNPEQALRGKTREGNAKVEETSHRAMPASSKSAQRERKLESDVVGSGTSNGTIVASLLSSESFFRAFVVAFL